MKTKQRLTLCAAILALIPVVGGCPSYGPTPETVAYVDLERYVGLWHEIASNPVFFNKDLYNVTAEYAALGNGTVSVLNKGHKGTAAGPETSIEGTATVVDTVTNSKLKVQFNVPFGFLFRGNYWIVLLDTDRYAYAVVTDNRQNTLFVLSRSATMRTTTYNQIIAELKDKDIDVSRLKVTGTLSTF